MFETPAADVGMASFCNFPAIEFVVVRAATDKRELRQRRVRSSDVTRAELLFIMSKARACHGAGPLV